VEAEGGSGERDAVGGGWWGGGEGRERRFAGGSGGGARGSAGRGGGGGGGPPPCLPKGPPPPPPLSLSYVMHTYTTVINAFDPLLHTCSRNTSGGKRRWIRESVWLSSRANK